MRVTRLAAIHRDFVCGHSSCVRRTIQFHLQGEWHVRRFSGGCRQRPHDQHCGLCRRPRYQGAGHGRFGDPENLDNGNITMVPVIRRVAAPAALVAAVPTDAAADAAKLVDAGFLAVVDAYTLTGRQLRDFWGDADASWQCEHCHGLCNPEGLFHHPRIQGCFGYPARRSGWRQH